MDENIVKFHVILWKTARQFRGKPSISLRGREITKHVRCTINTSTAIR